MDKDAPPSRAMIVKLLKLNGLQGKFDQILENFPATMAIPHMMTRDKNVHELIEKYLDRDEVTGAFHAIWAKHLTANDVLNYIAFLKTESGRHIVEKEDTIRMDMADAVLRIATDVALAIIDECKEKDLPPPEENPLT